MSKDVMQALAKATDKTLNQGRKTPKYGFVILVSEFRDYDGGRVNYVSNGNKSDMLAMMKEYIARCEGRYVEASEDIQ